MTTLLTVDPALARKAQRMQFAIDLLKSGCNPKQVRKRVEAQFQVCRQTAWRTVDKAQDLSA